MSRKAESPVKYTVLRDTSEHAGHGWVFEPGLSCSGTTSKNLYTGDYSLEGYYDSKQFVIERKGSVAEFVGNLTNKEKWDDFKQELERLEEFQHPFLVLEFPFTLLMSYPVGSSVPKKLWSKIRVSPAYLLKRLHEIELRFKTRIEFVGSDGHAYASSLFKRIVENVAPDEPR